MAHQIYFVNVNFLGNAGDYWSSPLKYYVFPSGYQYQQIHFLDFHRALTTQDQHQNLLFKDELVILGGGGLITTPGNYVNNVTRYLVENNRVITWGIGSNTTANIDWSVLHHKNLILATTRDINWGIDIEYLPCVSCKHQSFDRKHTQPAGLGIIEHPNYPIPISGDKISNAEDIEKIVDFISSKEHIITSTYHGFYWSQLLEKRVAVYVEPGQKINSKFIYTKHRPVLCNSYNYRERLEQMSLPVGLLQESRKLNDNFYQRVIQEILKNK
jgi:hypothetical protein